MTTIEPIGPDTPARGQVAGPHLAPSLADRMAGQRTELAYQRTRIAADRTMMAIMRTSLAMISFGFTIFSFFHSQAAYQALGRAVRDGVPGRFGLALVMLGVVLLATGIVADMRYMTRLRAQHRWLLESGLVEGLIPVERSLIVVSAIFLLLIGLAAIGIILVRM